MGFKSFQLKLQETGKKLKEIFRTWFPKRDKGLKKKVKRLVNKVAKLQVRARQSNHYIKMIFMIFSIINVVIIPMASTIYIHSHTAAMNEQMREINGTYHRILENQNNPSFGDMVGTVVDGAIGIYSLVRSLWGPG